MADPRDLLRVHAKDPISKDNLALLEEAKMEFMAKNMEAVENKLLKSMSAEEKLSRNPQLYLREVFPVGKSSTEAIVVKMGYATATQAVAKEIGLVAEIIIASIDPNAFWPTEERWVVVGQQNPVVADKVRSISREAQRIKEVVRDKEDAEKRREEATRRREEQDLKKPSLSLRTGTLSEAGRSAAPTSSKIGVPETGSEKD